MDIKRQIRLFLKSLAIVFLLVVALAFVSIDFQPVRAGINDSLIIIQPDGSVEGTDKIRVDGNVYTLTGDISGSPANGAYLISIKKDGITIDGQSKALLGSGTGVAIQIEGRNGVVVKNLIIDNFGVGIEVDTEFISGDTVTDEGIMVNSTNNQILNNHITTAYDGIYLQNAHDNLIKDNTIVTPSSSSGISIHVSRGNTVTGNKLSGGGIELFNQTQTIFSGNTLDGKAIIILDGASNQVIDDAGQVLLYNCRDMAVQNISPPSDLKVAVGFYGTSNSRIENCKGNIVLENSDYNTLTRNHASSIKLSLSHNNHITQNTIVSEMNYGIRIEFSTNNNIQANTVSLSNQAGISSVSKNNSIHGNNVYSCRVGIELSYFKEFLSSPPPPFEAFSINNTVYANNVTKCTTGISLEGADENKVFANNIAECNELGIEIYLADGNAFYHNNFLHNAQDVYEKHDFFDRGRGQFVTYYSANNTWDDGYPSGGNYWSNYTGTDADGDGIGDTAHIAFENHTDNYPLMTPLAIQDSTVTSPPKEETPNQQPTQPTEEQTKQQDLPISEIIIVSSVTVALCGLGVLIYFKKLRAKARPVIVEDSLVDTKSSD